MSLYQRYGKLRTLGTVVALSGIFGFSLTLANADDSSPQPHSDSAGAALSDAAITTKVKTKLKDDSRLKGAHISVATTNGVVTLTGSASNNASKSIAEDVAKNVEGVKSVDDDLKTPAEGHVASTTHHVAKKNKRIVSDSWITSKVKSKILADSVSKGFDVHVKTVHGVVMLNGTLANQAAIDHIQGLAEKVKGVKSVDTTGLKATGS